MCQSCSPICGNCKPPEYKPVRCSACGKAVVLTREECLLHLGRPHRLNSLERIMLEERDWGLLRCEACGASMMSDLTEQVKPMPCKYNGIVCGFPCGRQTEERPEGMDPCSRSVPMGRIKG